MRAAFAAIAIALAALGLQLAMVVGVIGPSLALALLGYAGLFAGMLMVVPAAIRQAQRRAKPGTGSAASGAPNRHLSGSRGGQSES